MVLGCYYLTAENPRDNKGGDRYFANMRDAVTAYEQGILGLHAYVWVRYDGEVETQEEDNEPVEVHEQDDGTVTKLYKWRRVREDAHGGLISQYIRTTTGRIILNLTIHEALQSI
jgi:DNA-directed RNA polymerase subunit beta'